MSEWIEINLPWANKEYLYPVFKEYPDLSARGKEIFGETQSEVRLRTVESVPYDSKKYNFPILEDFNELKYQIRREMIAEGFVDDGVGPRLLTPFTLELRKRLEATNNSNVKLVYEYWDFNAKWEAWLDAQPETIETSKNNDRIDQEWKNKQLSEGPSFSARKLNVAGTLMEVETYGQLRQVLIGDINSEGGVCGECMGISSEDIIKRYKIIWKPENV